MFIIILTIDINCNRKGKKDFDADEKEILRVILEKSCLAMIFSAKEEKQSDRD